MVVQHNMQAANASRMLNITTSAQAKSTEKLSSGYRINRAADDAAGLSISEKMRRQIKGLSQASTNASDGVSAVQTAEGALNEVHSMLQRMNELAVQAANGTNDTSDRQDIQNEITQLTAEIDRISQTTRFNESYLLKGNGEKSAHLVNAHDAGLAGKLTEIKEGVTEFKLTDIPKPGDKITIAGKDYKIGENLSTASYISVTAAENVPMNTGATVTVKTVNGQQTITLTDDVTQSSVTANAATKKGTIITADGTIYQYKDAGGADGAGWYKASTFSATAKSVNLASINIEGSTYTEENGTVARKIVPSQNENIVSTFDLVTVDGAGTTVKEVVTKANIGGYTTLAAGSSYSINGNEMLITHADYPAKAFESVIDDVRSAAAGTTVTINDELGTSIGGPYTIVASDAEEDVLNNKLTRDSIIELIKEGYQVEYTQGKDTAAGTTTKVTAVGLNPMRSDEITVLQAYAKMRDELEKASTIGSDADTPARVIDNKDGTFTINHGSVVYANPFQFNLHVGAEADMTNKIVVDVQSLDSKSLGLQGITIADDTGMSATYAIDVIADALNKVSAQRAELGAVQNRLEHSIANLDNVVENTEASESRIRDTDMADEMVKFSKNNILAQAGQSMLAQANQATQGVLSLLQ